MKRGQRSEGARSSTEIVATRGAEKPEWHYAPSRELSIEEQRSAIDDHERRFKAFIFGELDHRILADIDRMGAEVQKPDNIQMFVEMVAAGWLPPAPPKRGRGRPRKSPEERQTHPSEAAALLTVLIREIFEDYWGKRNHKRPSAEEIAAEYVGIRLKLVQTRKRRSKSRRPFRS